MASAVSVTAWVTSSTSVLVIERMASRSSISFLPIMSWLVAMGSPLSQRLLQQRIDGAGGGGRDGRTEAGEDEGPHRVTDRRRVGHVDAIRRTGKIRQQHPGHPPGSPPAT